MNIELKTIKADTKAVLRGEYTRDDLIEGVTWCHTPLFDSLAADRFASDRPVNPFNLGDYR